MCKTSRYFQTSHGILVATLALWLAGLSGCGSGERYSYVKVSGKVSYEDGSLIPADRIEVRFISQSPPLDAKTTPRPGVAEVDASTGNFEVVTTHTHGDGIVPGEHKVLVQALSRIKGPPAELVPPEYGDPEKTPLSVNSNQSPFDLKVRKPLPGKPKGK